MQEKAETIKNDIENSKFVTELKAKATEAIENAKRSFEKPAAPAPKAAAKSDGLSNDGENGGKHTYKRKNLIDAHCVVCGAKNKQLCTGTAQAPKSRPLGSKKLSAVHPAPPSPKPSKQHERKESSPTEKTTSEDDQPPIAVSNHSGHSAKMDVEI